MEPENKKFPENMRLHRRGGGGEEEGGGGPRYTFRGTDKTAPSNRVIYLLKNP